METVEVEGVVETVEVRRGAETNNQNQNENLILMSQSISHVLAQFHCLYQ